MTAICFIQLLGGLQVQQGKQTLTRFRTQKTASLLAYLACYRNRAHLREDLIALFWPDTDLEAGRMSLRTALSSLRRQLEPPGIQEGRVLLADRESVQLSSQTVTTDVERWEAALKAAALAQEPAERARHLQEAIALYKGPLLPGFYEEWALQERERLEQAYGSALRALIAAFERVGDREGAIAAGHRLVAVDPLNEEGYAGQMRLYAAAGQPEASLQQYRALATLLEREMGETPSAALQELAQQLEGSRREAAGSQASAAPIASTPARTTSSPPSRTIHQEPAVAEAALPLQLTRFFGREKEIAQLQALLGEGQTRLLTLTGPGGSGKTRLAIEAVRPLKDRFAGALWFVAMADVPEASLIAQTIAGAMQLPLSANTDPIDQIVQSLAGRPCLLALDNFEHLAGEGAAVVLEMLERIPALRLLVTSRQRLDLGGERELAVAPLPIPDTDGAAQTLEDFASVQLFVDRVQALRPDFQLTEENRATIALLCARLEGIPLALELAAAWAGILTPAQMLARLEHRFELLASKRKDLAPRHRTLRATIEWSYRLLTPPLQRFFASLSIFRGGWTLEAAEAVCAEPQALDHLQQLREHSLLAVEETPEGMRFRLLETLREYAAEQLSVEERSALQQRHLQFFLQLAEEGQEGLVGPQQEQWLARLEAEHDNLRYALEAAEGERSLRLVGALWRFWWMRGYWREGYERAQKCLAQTETVGRTAERAKAVYAFAILADSLAEFDTARASAEESLAIARETGDKRTAGGALHLLGGLTNRAGQDAAAWDYYEQSLAAYRDAADTDGMAGTLCALGCLARDHREFEKAERLYRESEALYRARNDRFGLSRVLTDIGYMRLFQDDLDQAEPLFQEALALRQQMHSKQGIAHVLWLLGEMNLDRDPSAARAYLEESLVMRRDLGEKTGMIHSLISLGHLAVRQNDTATAYRIYADLLPLARESKNNALIVVTLDNLRRAAEKLNDFDAASRYAAERLNAARSDTPRP